MTGLAIALLATPQTAHSQSPVTEIKADDGTTLMSIYDDGVIETSVGGVRLPDGTLLDESGDFGMGLPFSDSTHTFDPAFEVENMGSNAAGYFTSSTSKGDAALIGEKSSGGAAGVKGIIGSGDSYTYAAGVIGESTNEHASAGRFESKNGATTLKLHNKTGGDLIRAFTGNLPGTTTRFLVDGNGNVTADGTISVGAGLITKTQLDVQREVSGGAAAANHVAFFENTATSNGDVLALRSNADTPGDPVNFITFKNATDNIGAIEGNGSGGIQLDTEGGDFAEWLPRQRPDEQIDAGDVVGVEGGTVTTTTAGAAQVTVVTDRAAVVGNSPDEEKRERYEKVSFIGQVPVKTKGPVEAGDLLVASGKNDGTARAVAPSGYDPRADGPVVGQAWDTSEGGIRRVNAVVGPAAETAALRSVVQWQQAHIEELQEETRRIDELETRLEQLKQEKNRPLAASSPATGWLLGGLVLVGGLLLWRRRTTA